jgi:hypothetical protein
VVFLLLGAFGMVSPQEVPAAISPLREAFPAALNEASWCLVAPHLDLPRGALVCSLELGLLLLIYLCVSFLVLL